MVAAPRDLSGPGPPCCFHHPGLSAYFCYFAGDSTDDGSMGAYRYKKAK